MAALEIKKIDVLGFSMGCLAARFVVLYAPNLVRRLNLAETPPTAGEGIIAGLAENAIRLATWMTLEETEAVFYKSLYPITENGQK